MSARFLALLLLFLLFSGCGDTFDKSSSDASAVLVFGRGGDSVGLDPALEDDGESLKVCDSIYDNLVQYKDETTEVEPGLAKSWDVSDDELKWAFHLRSGVKFHDGTNFNADAVVFSLGRQFFKDHPFHKVEGTYKYWKSMGMDDIIKDIYATDDSTVVIQLSQQNATFLPNLAMNFCAIVSPLAVKKWVNDYFKHPVGTGPFKFVEWVKDERIVLERNPDYWGGPPKLGKLIFKSILENSVRFLELKTGSIDGMDNVIPDFVDDIKSDDNLKLLTQLGMNVGYLAMNMEMEPFNDRRVRIAINHAINKKSLVDNLYQGLAIPAKNPIPPPPAMWGYNDSIEDYAYDPQKAKKLLSEAGFADGFKTELWAMPVPRPYMPQPQKIAQAIQADLTAVGIEVRIVRYEWGTYLDKVENGDHQMALLGWTGDNGDPDNFLYVLLDKNAAVKPAQNIAFYRSEELHEVLVEARRITDRAKRAELYRKAQEIVHKDAPWVPLVHSTQMAVFKKSVVGFKLHPTGNKIFKNVWFDSSLKN